MNILKSWRESFSFFKPSFFKESFGLLKNFMPFFIKYFSWAVILLVIFGCVPNIALAIFEYSKSLKHSDPRQGVALIGSIIDWTMLVSYLAVYVTLVLSKLINFSFVAFISSKKIEKHGKIGFFRYLLVFVVWAVSIFFTGIGLLSILSVLYKFVDMPVAWIEKGIWLGGNILLLLPLTVFFAFELLRPQGSIKNIFKPFLSYPFFIIFMILYNIFILIITKLTTMLVMALFGLLPAAFAFSGDITLVVLLSIFSVFIDLFCVAVIANVYIKLFKQDGCPVRAWFSRLFGR